MLNLFLGILRGQGNCPMSKQAIFSFVTPLSDTCKKGDPASDQKGGVIKEALLLHGVGCLTARNAVCASNFVLIPQIPYTFIAPRQQQNR